MSVSPTSSNGDIQRSFQNVSKISMLRLNIGSGMLRLSSCMLRLSLTSSVQGGGGADTVAGGASLD